MYVYLLTTDMAYNWKNGLGVLPGISNGHCFYTMVAHETKFTEAEFLNLCNQCFDDMMPDIVAETFQVVGEKMLVTGHIQSKMTLNYGVLIGKLFYELIANHGFTHPQKGFAYSLPRSVVVDINPTKKHRPPLQMTNYHRIKESFHRHLKQRERDVETKDVCI